MLEKVSSEKISFFQTSDVEILEVCILYKGTRYLKIMNTWKIDLQNGSDNKSPEKVGMK